jgi:hypothetical protein
MMLAMAGTGLARTWTSADGKSTFEGDLVSSTDREVTVKRSNKNLTFTLDKLSEADQAYIREEAEKAAANAAAKAESDKLKEAKIPKALAGKLEKLDADGKKYADFNLEDGVIPKYYIVYFSASW